MSSAQQWLRFTRLALEITEAALPAYAHKFSPRRFTLPQLAACVLLKEYRQLDWRGVQGLLELAPGLRQGLGLQEVPDYTTLWRFARRWLEGQKLGRLLVKLANRLGVGAVTVAVDSTGLDPDRTSSYFRARRERRQHRKRYVKLSLSVWWWEPSWRRVPWQTGDRAMTRPSCRICWSKPING